jgi:hypothetical protein
VTVPPADVAADHVVLFELVAVVRPVEREIHEGSKVAAGSITFVFRTPPALVFPTASEGSTPREQKPALVLSPRTRDIPCSLCAVSQIKWTPDRLTLGSRGGMVNYGATRGKSTLEFKTEAVHRVIDTGRSVVDVADELSVVDGLLPVGAR